MEIKIKNFTIGVSCKTNLKSLIANKYNIPLSEIEQIKILRQSVDARKKNNIVYNYQFYLCLNTEKTDLLKDENIEIYRPNPPVKYPQWTFAFRPIVVGFGPAGMFAALYLARCQAKPIIIERGSAIENRKKEVETFLSQKQLNPNSNVQFGEGGAGAFSDGKLTTNLSDKLIDFILFEFFQHGATEDITYSSTPHIGTDYLEKVVKNIREEIIALGGEFHFNTTFVAFDKNDNTINIHCSNKQTFTTEHLLLCIGHSARDTIAYLFQKGLAMEPKSFSIGVRIEHLQSKINKIQYGRFAPYLPPASYKGAVHLKNNRSVYVFCMCPGGIVMASTDTPESIVTNGMSKKNRAEKNANSALLVGITPEDYYKNSPLDGLWFQEKYEKLAFAIAKDYKAPCNLVGEFLQNKVATQIRSVKPSYPHGIHFCDLNRCLPDFAVNALREAIPLFDNKMKGFNDPDAVLTGVETRSSSPVRILRNETLQTNVSGIYPVGEGAGYAGGIVSAALDGLKTAMKIAGFEYPKNGEISPQKSK